MIDSYELANRLFEFSCAADQYCAMDTGFRYEDALNTVNDPKLIESAIMFMEDTKSSFEDIDDAHAILYFGITKKDHKKLLSDLKKRRRQIK